MKNLFLVIFLNIIYAQIHFSDLPEETGVSQMVIIENIFGLDPGDEVGLFDLNGLLSSGSDCIDNYGEILVGSGIYNGDQMNIVGISSNDFCDFNDGYQLPGFVEGNPILIKVWDASEDIEYIPEIILNQGSSNWVETSFCAVDLIVNELSVNNNEKFSLFEIYPNPFNSTVTFNLNYDTNNILNILIYNSSGKLVDQFNNINPLSIKKIIWDASNFRSGVYFVNFHSSNSSLTQKITLIK